MENKKTINFFVIAITVLVCFSSINGILSINLKNEFDFTTIYGQVVKIYGGGIYKYHTIAQVYQVIPHDMVNLIMAVPALLISFIYTKKGSLKARLFFMGVVLYLLFTFTIYTFYTMYNKLFIVYIAIMGLCFYTLYLTVKQTDSLKVKSLFQNNYPTKLMGVFMVFASSLMTMSWLQPVFSTVFFNKAPVESLAQGTTLVVNAIDLAFVLPVAFVMGIKLLKKKQEAYATCVVIPVFLMFMMTAVFSKGLMLYITNTDNVIPMMIMIGTFDIFALMITVINFKYMKKEGSNGYSRKTVSRA